MELGRGRLGPARSAWSFGGMRISVRELGGGPAREMRIACFLHDPQVTAWRDVDQSLGKDLFARPRTPALRNASSRRQGPGLYLNSI